LETYSWASIDERGSAGLNESAVDALDRSTTDIGCKVRRDRVCLIDLFYELRKALPVTVPMTLAPLHELVDVRNGSSKVKLVNWLF
jgi:hypothetical protein